MHKCITNTRAVTTAGVAGGGGSAGGVVSVAATQWPQATADERAAASGNIAKTIANFMCQPSECATACMCVCVYFTMNTFAIFVFILFT